MGMIYTILGSFCSFFNWVGAVLKLASNQAYENPWYPEHMSHHMRFWYLSHRRPTDTQTSLHIRCLRAESMKVDEGSE